MKLSALAVGVSWWLAICLGVWLLLFVLDNLLHLPAGLRLPLAVGGAVLAGIGFVKKVFKVAAEKQRLERTAVILERKFNVGDNALINACQFEARQFRPEEQAFARQTLALGARQMSAIRISDLWNPRELWRWAAGAAAVVLLWTIYVAVFPRHVLNAGARFALPLADRPPVASVQMRLNPAADLTVLEGENLEISVAIVSGEPGDPPTLTWKESVAGVDPRPDAGDSVMMAPVAGERQKFSHTFAEVRRPFAFRVFAGDAYSRSVRIEVRPLPRIKEAVFQLTPPAYTGLPALAQPGPPAPISLLPNGRMDLAMAIEPAVSAVFWKVGEQRLPLAFSAGRWRLGSVVTNAGEYEIEIALPGLPKPAVIARGAVRLETDQLPEIDFLTSDRNRFVNLGSKIKLDLQARDDFGLREIGLSARTPDQEQPLQVFKVWPYLGPPGNKGPVTESHTLEIDPRVFKPETAYLIEALAADFRPGAPVVKSRPIMLRVKSPDSYAPAIGDPLLAAFSHLRSAITCQERSLNQAADLRAYLPEALEKQTLKPSVKSIASWQTDAHKHGLAALKQFRAIAEGRLYAAALGPLAEGEMPWVLRDLAELDEKKPAKLPDQLMAVTKRQTFILNELLALLGRFSENKQQAGKTNALAKEFEAPPLAAPEQMAKDLADDLKKFVAEQERIIERTKTLLDKGPEDLTDKDEEILGELAREEAKWGKFFEEKLTDFSKLPAQDFADGKLSKELNEVFQEIKLAAESLYGKKMELAVPHEQSGLENAKELEQNLERWLPDTPDRVKWNMEEPLTPADIAMAELPAELEDIIGELIDKEEEMGEDVEDVSSPWLDSIDKGAGWGASDGPISSMSAKGVTGNMLPNNMEIGGRSGEGRTGKSSGQMVEDSAEGKGGRETPTRVSPSPFEQGSVKDSDTKSQGGATGGGKLSGTGAEGLRGPPPPMTGQKLPRLADQQAKIRQQAESLAMSLRRHNLPTGDLEKSIQAMKKFEASARQGDGLGVRRAFSAAVDALGDAKQSARVETGLHRERTRLPEWYRDEIKTGLSDGVPKGYEEMVGEYFKVLADQKGKTGK